MKTYTNQLQETTHTTTKKYKTLGKQLQKTNTQYKQHTELQETIQNATQIIQTAIEHKQNMQKLQETTQKHI